MRLNQLLKLMFWFLLFESIGFLLGMLTQANIYPWYESLNKSSLTPPGFVFSVVWSLLYALLALVAVMLFHRDKESSNNKLMMLFVLQMLMNWAWTPLFFGLHWIMLSAIWLVGLTALNGILIIQARNEAPMVAWLLIPYLIWLMFACYLNGVIAWFN
ncbi:tryptophan-rich sensory protein [Legionella moravica]|uniref:Tryptophan-rich sensory protein n=1 Tax=Legionella moravica TaxID=39962 RepID=A0A378JX93_9GAMM|nr:TspO/MBR family protein [Legionella moravica]KTD35443.1 tryptophan-rich sensory protein [Legionella moravica]STX62028.1 tryptophan-rich sensory protein [Legionella moravica]